MKNRLARAIHTRRASVLLALACALSVSNACSSARYSILQPTSTGTVRFPNTPPQMGEPDAVLSTFNLSSQGNHRPLGYRNYGRGELRAIALDAGGNPIGVPLLLDSVSDMDFDNDQWIVKDYDLSFPDDVERLALVIDVYLAHINGVPPEWHVRYRREYSRGNDGQKTIPVIAEGREPPTPVK